MGFAPVARAGETSATKPNILLIISDDQRYDCFGGAGNPHVITPAEDRIAKTGVYFPEATIHITQCAPSLACMLTGLPPHENGWYSNQVQRKDVHNENGFDQYKTVAKELKGAGYDTIEAGKWHFLPTPWSCGFDRVGTWMPAGSGKYKGAKLAHGKTRETQICNDFTQKAFTDSAIDMLTSRPDSSKPFFMWLAYTAPHTPLGPNPESVTKLYANVKSEKELWPAGYVQDDQRDARWKEYYTAISDMDQQVDRVLKTLDKEGLTTNTVVIFLGDNGLMMGSRDWHGKVIPYEESVRVPMMITAPGMFKGDQVSSACVSSLDLPVTMLALAGLDKPANWPGRNMVPLLEGKSAEGFDDAICEFPDAENTKFANVGYYLIRTPHYKLIEWLDPKKPAEFYDIQADPHEKKNLASDPSVGPIKEKLAKKLAEWKAKTHVTPETSHELVKAKPQLTADGRTLLGEKAAHPGKKGKAGKKGKGGKKGRKGKKAGAAGGQGGASDQGTSASGAE
jgi:arylsulfatase A-like enzyme